MKKQSVLSLSDQIEYFKDYIMKLKLLVGENKTNFILAKGLFLVVAGSDDIANTYFTLRARKLQYDIPAYTDLMANSASDFLNVSFSFLSVRMHVYCHALITLINYVAFWSYIRYLFHFYYYFLMIF